MADTRRLVTMPDDWVEELQGIKPDGMDQSQFIRETLRLFLTGQYVIRFDDGGKAIEILRRKGEYPDTLSAPSRKGNPQLLRRGDAGTVTQGK